MRWISITVAVYVLAAVDGVKLRCPPSQPKHTCSKNKKGRFIVDGIRISISYTKDNLNINCTGAKLLESPAMPIFTRNFNVATVKLGYCHLPETRSIADVLLAYNVTLQQTNDTEASLTLVDFRSNPKPTAQHFKGLEQLESLELKSSSFLKVSVDIFAGLTNLRSLKTVRVSINSGDLIITDLGLADSTLSLPNKLQKYEVQNWREKRFPVFVNCKDLYELNLYKPNVEELPDCWVAACSHLEKFTLEYSEKILSLPKRLFEGASVKHITITKVKNIESLPEGFLEGVPNLISFEMSYSRLKTLSSEVFRGSNLLTLTLSSNKLETNALDSFASLTSLTKLDLSNNANIEDVCEENGYSKLRNLVNLEDLSLVATSITRICRDWREDLTFLKYLDLKETYIEVLKFTDFEYTRDDSVEDPEVILDDTTISSIRFTEEDYNRTLTTLPEDPTVLLSWSYDTLSCDCDMYWTRKTLAIANFTLIDSPRELMCKDGRYFINKRPEKLCPEKAITAD